MRRWLLAVIAGLMILAFAAASAAASGGPQTCRGGSGGAFNVRVQGITCRYATYVTEHGLQPDARVTRAGHFDCRRHRAGSLWAYRCVRAGGRQTLEFNTY